MDGLCFPHHMPNSPEAVKTRGMRNHTLMDGELVIDTDEFGRQKLILLLFDLIVIDRECLSERPLSRRYGRLTSFIYPPYVKYLKQHPEQAGAAPFDVQIKKMDLSYGVQGVLEEVVPNLKHGNDGLIFTCLNSGYVMGTDPKILKWKPPSENTIDFKLVLRFPPDLERDPRGNLPDLTSMPFCELHQYVGGGGEAYEYFDELWIEPDEWDAMVQSGEQYDDRIVECRWLVDPEPATDSLRELGLSLPPRWRMTRIRDDKLHANHRSVVEKILISIRDGVDQDELVAAAPSIRAAWKSAERERYRKQSAAAPNPTQQLRPSITSQTQPQPFNSAVPFGGMAYLGTKGGTAPPLTSGGLPGIIRR